ncbi:MAG: M20 family metallopeptidase [Eubacteriaceae bacterium]|jgi:hippurate hydrolase|nr:M20 family metallopeptidase [Eubacteriaceae bacterium]
MTYRTEAEKYYDVMTADRRNLHRIPEIQDDLPETKAYVLAQLGGMKCAITEYMQSGVTAYFDFGREKTLAFRCDMDALRITEKNTCGFVSEHDGNMHACGHDGHMAMALGLAHYCDDSSELPVNVLIIFEPNEEGLGGAEALCKTGILDERNVDAVFGTHMWPFGEKGVVTVRPGAMMAQSAEIDVRVRGKSAHAANKGDGIDAINASVEFLHYVAQMRLDETPDDEVTIICMGKFHGGTMRNVLAGSVEMNGTMRGYNSDLFKHLQECITDIADEIEHKTGAKFSVHFSDGYPPVINNPDLYEKIRPVLEDEGAVLKKDPEMISDDFSFFGKYRPAIYFFLGTGTNEALHTADFNFDEHVLISGLSLYIALVNKYTFL